MDGNLYTDVDWGENGAQYLQLWPVLDGNPGAVPVLGALTLFSSGLLGLISIARRRKAE
jgi:hypothetical protein